MKSYNFKPLLALPLLVLGGALQSAQAVVVASASIDWNGLNVQLIDLSGGVNAPQFSWLTQQGGAYSDSVSHNSNGSHDSQSADDFVTSLSASSVDGLSQGSASRNSTTLQAQAQSANSGTGMNIYDFGSAGGSNQGTYQLSGKGVALLTLNYQLDMSGVVFNNNINLTGLAGLTISNYYSDTNGSAGASNIPFQIVNANDSKHGSIRLAIPSDGTNLVTGTFSVTTNVKTEFVSAVPLPAASWLFGSAFISALAVFRRKTSGLSISPCLSNSEYRA